MPDGIINQDHTSLPGQSYRFQEVLVNLILIRIDEHQVVPSFRLAQAFFYTGWLRELAFRVTQEVQRFPDMDFGEGVEVFVDEGFIGDTSVEGRDF